MTFAILFVSIVILACLVGNRISNRIGVPMLLIFIVLGMFFGSDGVIRISFENFELAEQICSIALIFIMFYGGFGTKWSAAKPIALRAVILSTAGVVLTAGLTALFCYYALHIGLLESLLIGSLISSTDAASVFSILRSKRLNLKYRTASLLEVESGSNDPCSYMPVSYTHLGSNRSGRCFSVCSCNGNGGRIIFHYLPNHNCALHQRKI